MADAKWLLTGTPSGVAEDLHGASQLLGAHLGPAVSYQRANEFLMRCVWQTQISTLAVEVADPLELVVDVRLQPEERILYRQAEHKDTEAVRSKLKNLQKCITVHNYSKLFTTAQLWVRMSMYFNFFDKQKL